MGQASFTPLMGSVTNTFCEAATSTRKKKNGDLESCSTVLQSEDTREQQPFLPSGKARQVAFSVLKALKQAASLSPTW